jgi:hypothetical protein
MTKTGNEKIRASVSRDDNPEISCFIQPITYLDRAKREDIAVRVFTVVTKRAMKTLRLSSFVILFLLCSILPCTTACESTMEEGKTSWPELVGKTGEEAKQVIQDQYPDFNIQIIPENSMVTMDYRTDRVRVFINANGIVTGTPQVG